MLAFNRGINLEIPTSSIASIASDRESLFSSCPIFVCMNSSNRRFRYTEPQSPPLPMVISSTRSIGVVSKTWYVVRSYDVRLVKIRNGVRAEVHTTVPPPASQVIKTSPFFTEKSGSYLYVSTFNNGALGSYLIECIYGRRLWFRNQSDLVHFTETSPMCAMERIRLCFVRPYSWDCQNGFYWRAVHEICRSQIGSVADERVCNLSPIRIAFYQLQQPGWLQEIC